MNGQNKKSAKRSKEEYIINNWKGFTLTEIMIVIAIVGILASIAISNYNKFQAKSKQTEAINNLEAIYISEIAYFGEYHTYSSSQANIGFSQLKSGRYSYTINTSNTTAFVATASANIDSDIAIDIWTIDQNKNLRNINNDVTN